MRGAVCALLSAALVLGACQERDPPGWPTDRARGSEPRRLSAGTLHHGSNALVFTAELLVSNRGSLSVVSNHGTRSLVHT
jgi:hypothetical protein